MSILLAEGRREEKKLSLSHQGNHLADSLNLALFPKTRGKAFGDLENKVEGPALSGSRSTEGIASHQHGLAECGHVPHDMHCALRLYFLHVSPGRDRVCRECPRIRKPSAVSPSFCVLSSGSD